jgi:hypothetical protein
MATKKSFKTNPALSFISQESIDKVEQPESSPSTAPARKKAPAGYKPNPEFIETKSKRVQILVQPSLYRDAKALSSELGISLNDFIHRAIQEATYSEYVQQQIKKDLER